MKIENIDLMAEQLRAMAAAFETEYWSQAKQLQERSFSHRSTQRMAMQLQANTLTALQKMEAAHAAVKDLHRFARAEKEAFAALAVKEIEG